MKPKKPSVLRTAGRLAAYSGVAVVGLVGTRFLADIAARGIKKPWPLWGTLLGTWTVGALVTAKWGGPYATAAMIGSGLAVLDEGLAHALPAIGFGPHQAAVPPRAGAFGVCPVQTPGPFPRPSLFRPAWRDACDPNFWRGRWVDCRRPDGFTERRWCHDAYRGSQCCPPGAMYTAMANWPNQASFFSGAQALRAMR